MFSNSEFWTLQVYAKAVQVHFQNFKLHINVIQHLRRHKCRSKILCKINEHNPKVVANCRIYYNELSSNFQNFYYWFIYKREKITCESGTYNSLSGMILDYVCACKFYVNEESDFGLKLFS
jgi:predicted nucleic acid binding AN1-type Zn finger protein